MFLKLFKSSLKAVCNKTINNKQRARLARRAACLRRSNKPASKIAVERFGAQRHKQRTSPPLRALTNLKLAILMSGLERSDQKMDGNPGCFSGVAIKHRKFRSKVHQPKLLSQAKLLRRDDRHGRCLRHDRAARVFRIEADYLSRLWRLKSHLACQRIDPARIAQ